MKRSGITLSQVNASAARAAGFTLLEVLLALSLTALLFGIIATSISLYWQGSERGRKAVENAQLARALMTRLASDLRSTSAAPPDYTEAVAAMSDAIAASQQNLTTADTAAQTATATQNPNNNAQPQAGGPGNGGPGRGGNGNGPGGNGPGGNGPGGNGPGGNGPGGGPGGNGPGGPGGNGPGGPGGNGPGGPGGGGFAGGGGGPTGGGSGGGPTDGSSNSGGGGSPSGGAGAGGFGGGGPGPGGSTPGGPSGGQPGGFGGQGPGGFGPGGPGGQGQSGQGQSGQGSSGRPGQSGGANAGGRGGSSGGAPGGSPSASPTAGNPTPAAANGQTAADTALVEEDAAAAPAPGVSGTETELNVDIDRPLRSDEFSAAAGGSSTPLGSTTLSYYLQGTSGGDSSLGIDATSGLVRREINRTLAAASIAGATGLASPDQALVLAPEVEALQFRYYDGSQWTTSWDSATQQTAPVAVEIQMSLRTSGQAAGSTQLNSYDRLGNQAPLDKYRLVVQVPSRGAPPKSASGETSTSGEAASNASGSKSGSATASPQSGNSQNGGARPAANAGGADAPTAGR